VNDTERVFAHLQRPCSARAFWHAVRCALAKYRSPNLARAGREEARGSAWSGLDGPLGVSFWLVAAERAGADCGVEVAAEPGMGVGDASDGGAQAAADCFAGAFEVVG
jgi:hypothetical protein